MPAALHTVDLSPYRLPGYRLARLAARFNLLAASCVTKVGGCVHRTSYLTIGADSADRIVGPGCLVFLGSSTHGSGPPIPIAMVEREPGWAERLTKKIRSDAGRGARPLLPPGKDFRCVDVELIDERKCVFLEAVRVGANIVLWDARGSGRSLLEAESLEGMRALLADADQTSKRRARALLPLLAEIDAAGHRGDLRLVADLGVRQVAVRAAPYGGLSPADRTLRDQLAFLAMHEAAFEQEITRPEAADRLRLTPREASLLRQGILPRRASDTERRSLG